MRLAVDHRATYRFPAPRSRLTHLLRMTPDGTHDQSVIGWDVHVDCDARLREGRDGWGNRTTMLYVEGPIDRIEIVVSGEVLTSASNGIVRGAQEPLPPSVFLRATPLTLADAAIVDFARGIGETDPVARLHAVNLALHRRFAPDAAPPTPGRTASEAFAEPAACARDRAQMFLAAARALGIPARYVAGYAAGQGAAAPRLGPHAWVEAHVAGLGWIAFDPMTGLSADEAYVRVAVALDSAGAAPVAGNLLGEGEAVTGRADPSGQ